MKSENTFLLILLYSLTVNVCLGGIFSWLFKKDKEHSQDPELCSSFDDKPIKNEYKYPADDAALSVKVPFELNAADEKFIKEVAEYTSTKLSELDVCHHRVIVDLKKSCSDLTEEDLAKVAVSLLNCQSAVENRAVYPCTENMLLAECTKNMDSDTWNAYHIISNRVRAVCYHFRQQQFTAKTEMTVNKLMLSTEEQIDAMRLLEESQSNLKKATSETLNSLSSGHEFLQKQQRELSSAQLNIRNYVSLNIRDLTREKRLIASGQKELSEITLAIKRKLEEAQGQLRDQGKGQRDTHQKILQDLSEIQESAGRVWGQIDESTKMIMLKHEQTVLQYERLMEDLQKMNSTVQHLMDVLIKMKYKVEEKFSWISSLVGDTDATVQKIYSFVLHICYCLLAMVAASFLQVPYATRLALIILVPLNALSEMKNETSMHFSTLTLLLGICMFFNVSSIGALKLYNWRKLERQNSILYAPSQTTNGKESPVNESSSEVTGNNVSRKMSMTNDTFEDYSSEEESTPNRNAARVSHNISSSYISPMPSISEEEEERRNSLHTSTESVSTRAYQVPSFYVRDDVRRRLLCRNEEINYFSKTNKLSDSLPSPRNVSPERSEKILSSSRNSPSQSLTPKKLCTATCKSGLLCKNVACLGESLCFRHSRGLSRESTPVH